MCILQTSDINRALINACEKGCIEKVTVLLDLGADVNYQAEVKQQNLYIIILQVHCQQMLFILTDLTLQRGQSALWWSSYAGRTECVKVLLKYGAQVDLPVRCDVM